MTQPATKKKISLTSWIMIALVTGMAVGILLHFVSPAKDAPDAAAHWTNFYLVDGLFRVISEIFIRSLKMLVVPLVFVSLVCGVCSLGDPKKLGRIGGKTVGLYVATTAAAVTIALIAATMFGVGKGEALIESSGNAIKQSPPLSDVLINIFPSNPIASMAEGTMLQVIFFAILFGLALALVRDRARVVVDFFNAVNEVIMKMIMILMGIAPFGVFAVVAIVFSKSGFGPIQELLRYFAVMIGVLLLHLFGVYSALLAILGRLNPLRFFENARPAMMMAFSTASSNATIPVTMETIEKHHGVHNSVASFTIPLGATINMDGTAIMQGIATVFIANAAGIDLSFQQYLMVILTATLASIGTAGVPGVGMVTLAMVLKQVGLPEHGILLLLPVDRILDMCRTTVNVTGDMAVSCVVAKGEGQLAQNIYDQPLGKEYGEYSFPRG